MLTTSFFGPGNSNPTNNFDSSMSPISSSNGGSNGNFLDFFNMSCDNSGSEQTDMATNNWLTALLSTLYSQGGGGNQGNGSGNQGNGYQRYQGNGNQWFQGVPNYGGGVYYSSPYAIYGLGTFAVNPFNFMQGQGQNQWQGQGQGQWQQGGQRQGQGQGGGRGRQNGGGNRGQGNGRFRNNFGSNYDYYGFGSGVTFNQGNNGRRPNGNQNSNFMSNGNVPFAYQFG